MVNQSKNDSTPVPRTDVSLIRGGPFYRLQQSTRLIEPDEWNVGRRITFAIAVAWVPLVLIKLLFDRSHLLPFLRDYGLNVRVFVAIPVLIAAQPLMESIFRKMVNHIYAARLLDDEDLPRMDELLARLVRLRDSWLPEVIILLLVAVRTMFIFKTQLPEYPWMTYGTGNDIHLTLTGWYALLVSAPILQFLVGLTLWKWLLWTVFAFKFSKFNLRAVATHPDENGGLGFLGMTPLAFAPLAFATTIVIGATFRRAILHQGAHLNHFVLPAIVLAAIFLIMALGPLAFFVPRLAAVRRKGMLDYAILGQIQSTDFQEKWIVARVGNDAEFMGAPEISTLCDYGQAYEKIEDMKPFPIDKGALIGLALAVVIPALPTVVAEIPLAVILKQLLGALR
ncbi:MAG: hypothetical protein WBS19_07175 [Candidatus Korobacteraceae bacterium]